MLYLNDLYKCCFKLQVPTMSLRRKIYIIWMNCDPTTAHLLQNKLASIQVIKEIVCTRYRTNVPPYVPRHPPCRDESIINGSWVLFLWVYKLLASIRLLFGRFSIRTRSAPRKYRDADHAVDLSVDGVKSHFSYTPLLHYEYRLVYEFRSYNIKLLLRRGIASKFWRHRS